MDIDDALNAVRAVERGEAPSGSVIIALTGPNSLTTPGGAPTPPPTGDEYVTLTFVVRGLPHRHLDPHEAGLDQALALITPDETPFFSMAIGITQAARDLGADPDNDQLPDRTPPPPAPVGEYRYTDPRRYRGGK